MDCKTTEQKGYEIKTKVKDKHVNANECNNTKANLSGPSWFRMPGSRSCSAEQKRANQQTKLAEFPSINSSNEQRTSQRTFGLSIARNDVRVSADVTSHCAQSKNRTNATRRQRSEKIPRKRDKPMRNQARTICKLSSHDLDW